MLGFHGTAGNRFAMETSELFSEIKKFSNENQGSSNYFKEEYFIQGATEEEYAPFSYLKKSVKGLDSLMVLLTEGFVLHSFAFFGSKDFLKWYETKFARKITDFGNLKITIVKQTDNKTIFSAVEKVNEAYSVLREQQIILNGKNLPTQLGEWYARIIFGLYQKKSASQRGFDFYLGEKIVEVKVHWSDLSSPKGVKLKRSLVALSDFCIIMYVANNFMIREICFLDSPYVIRKFGAKSQTMFLKDSDISEYFYSKSKKHQDKIVNPVALMKFSTPTFALKITDRF